MFDLKKYAETITANEKAIEIDPHYSDAWTGKGLALSRLGKSDNSRKAYNKAIEIEKQGPSAWYIKILSKLIR